MRIPVTARFWIDSDALEISYLAGTGPGGQNVNKVATTAQLRFDARGILPVESDIMARLRVLAGSRMTLDDVIVITARRHRSQERNRQDAIARLVELLRAATIRPVTRRPTKASYGERQRRLEAKKRRSSLKQGRGARCDD